MVQLFSTTTPRALNKIDNIKAQNIIDQTDTIFRESFNKRMHRNDVTGISIDPGASPSFGKSIVGTLKKRFAPDRGIQEGMHINKFKMTDMYTSYVGENLVKFSVDKYAEACVRNGFYIDSKNPLVTKYLNKRFKEFEIISKTPTTEMITDALMSIIMYGNCPLILHRQKEASSGNEYTRWDGQVMTPIASIYTEDFRKMLIGEGPAGRQRYVRIDRNVDDVNFNSINPSLFNLPKGTIYGDNLPLYAGYFGGFTGINNLFKTSSARRKQYIVYEEDEVCHIRYHHVPGEKIAMPPFWPTMNDIDSLRRIEENIELLVYQYGHPIMHGKVGDDKKRGDQNEIDDLYAKIERMESNGFLVTDNRTMIEMIGAENQALRLDFYLMYFYRRVLTGLWLSEVTVGIGDTSNRSTANTLDKLSQEKVVELQNIFAQAMQPIMLELIQEAGASISWAMLPENIPNFVFNPVDIEGLIKKEAHTLVKWQANMLTEDEMRRELGKEPLKDSERESTYTYLHSIPLAETSPKLDNTNPDNKASNKVNQKTLRPANQNGKKTGPSPSQNS